ncbi:MAG TPA: preprotein translocase subunit SecG [Gammaproteobacteria bacterium]|nr:preprotein translocase subunit SecG [Gammaproteobacteria bacterium]
METVLVVIHLFLAIGLVGLVLIQHGKGADMGAAFGSGASATVFGSAGAGNFLSRSTAVLATLFFLTSLALAYFAMQKGEEESLLEKQQAAPAVQQPAPAPAAPAVPSDLPAVPEVAAPAAPADAPPVPPAAVPAAAELPEVPAVKESEAPAPAQ